MVQIGNHLKMNIPTALRQHTRDFYRGLLKCKPMDSPSADLDLYEFDGGFVLGLFFRDPSACLTDEEHLRATWMELKVDDAAGMESSPVGLRRARGNLSGPYAVLFPGAWRTGFSRGAD